MYLGQNIYKRNFTKLVSLIIVFTWLAQIIGLNNIALGAAPYTFKGYESENITSETFTCNGATKSSGTITMTSTTQGEAIGFVTFEGAGSDIATSIDLGGLEVDFSANTTVTPEGDAGSENDVPSASIDFCSQGDYQDVISSVNIAKPDKTAAAYTLSSNASIPKNTRSLIIHLYGTNTSGSNTVVFSGMSFKVHDAAAPACAASYDNGWTNKPVTVTVTASDADSGLEGIYKDGTKVSSTSPYTYTASANTSFSVYSKDYAGKSSDTKDVNITNIDTTAPLAPASITLSKNTWTNQDVTVTLPSLGTSTGAPEKYTYSVNSGSYKDVPADFKLTDTGTYNVSVKTADAAGNVSSSAVSATAYIDKEVPTISKIDQKVSSGSADVTVTAGDTGGSGLDKMKYASGSHDADYFSTSGTDVSNNKFTVNAGGNYTVFVSDKAGNTCVKEFGLNTAPVLADITDKSTNEDTTLNVPLTVSDAESSLDKLKITAGCSDNTLIQSVTVNQSASAASLDIKPGANLHGGPVTITVNVEDEGGEKVSDTFNVTVISVNDPPIAQDDLGITTTEGKAVTIDVLANDSDPADNDTLTISDPGKPSGGSAAAVDGKIVYTPNDYFNGSDSFIYTISDGNGGTASATVSITVSAVNDPPVAVDDTAETTEDTSVLIDVLHNDTDPDLKTTAGEQLSLVSVENGSLGTAAIEDGKVRYTPGKDSFGKDTFKYTITDKGGLTCTGNVKVMIDGVNDPPQFEGLNSEYTIDEDSVNSPITFNITDIETPADSLMLQAVSSNENLLKNSKLLITGLKDNDPSVTLTLTPEANQNGDLTISMVLGDGFLTTSASFTLHIRAVNDDPVAKNDTIYYDEDTDCVTIDTSTLIANDTDIDVGDTLSFAGIDTTTSIGTLTAKDETNTVYYYHPVKYSAEPDSFIYKVTDGHSSPQTAKCTLISKAINHAPEVTIHDASYTTDEDTAITGITFSISDHETESGDLTVTASCDKTSLVSTDGITVKNNGDGTCSLSITPMPDQNGTAKITVSVSDGNLKTDGTFNLVINPEPDPPVAVNDSYYVPVSGSITFDPLLNDRDPDGDTLTVKSFDKGTLGGTLTLDDSKQNFKYVARTGETGKYTFTYVVTDGTYDRTATVTLDINTITHPPVVSAISDRYINEDGSAGGISFTASDSDYGDSLTVSASSGNTTLVPNDSEHIVLTDNGDGSYSLTIKPAARTYGYAQITITVTDKQSHTVTRSFGLNVYKVNYPPKAVNDDITTNEDTPVTLNMLGNDSDPEGDSIYISDVSSPSNGYITRSGDTYTYTPYGNFNGTDSVTYWVTDGQSTSAATATIHVTPVNDSPTARTDWATVPNSTGSESVDVPVLGNDYDIDGDTLKVYSVTQGKYGTVSINADNTVTYTRSKVSPDDNGADTFTYTIIDRSDATGDYRSAIATVYIGVVFHSTLYCEGTDIWRAEDSAPYTFSLPISNPNSIDYTLSVGTCSLGSFAVVDNPSGNDTKVTFTPTPDANGSASVTYTITGHNNTTGADETDTSYIYVYLYPVDDAPVIDSAPASVSCDEEKSAEIDYTFHDVDCANDALYLYAYAENISSGGPIPIQLGISTTRNGGTAAVTLTPIADTFGHLDIVIGVSDGIIKTERTVHMTINPIDDAPRISDINEEMYEDMDVTFAAVTPSTDVDGDGLTVSIADGNGPAHGKAVISGGAITYTPDENWNGTDTIKYTVTDKTAAALSSTKTATIIVDPVNDPPVITGLDYYQKTDEDTPKTIGFTITDPDSDMTSPDSYTITSSNTDLAKNIVISHVSGNGMQVKVTPAANAFGKTVIGITANDGDKGHPLSAYAEFELTVISVNDVPLAVDDSVSVDEHVGIPAGTTSININVLANDSDVEDGKQMNVVAITGVSKGSVVKNKDGTLTYSVDGDYNGTATFSYTIMDKNGATATAEVTVTINPKNDPPSALDDTVTIDEDQVITVPVLTNDTDPDGDTLTITGADTCGHGTVTVTEDKTGVIYTPNKDYNGTDSFKYYISDGKGGTASATVTLTIKPENDPPAISKHSSNSGEWTMNEDETKAFNFVVSDPETPVENLIIKIASQKESVIKSTNIKLTSADGYKVITVTPEDNANGDVPVQFDISDGALTTTQTYIIKIAPVNDPPVLTAPARTMPEDAVLNSKVTATDIDSDLSSLVFSKATDPSHGSVTVNADGTYVYTPSANWSGTDRFNITVSDGAASDTKTEVITVTPLNDPPSAADDSVDTNEDTPVTVNVLSNDTDPDTDYGDSISIKSVGSASHGTAEIVDGGIKYTSNLNWNGTDSFTYVITDKSGKTSSAKVTVNVKPVNDAPSGGDDNASTPEDTPITIEATANDDIDEITNPGLENLNITAVSAPSHGTAAATEDKKSITYTPAADWNGTDAFTYDVQDIGGITATFHVTVVVNPVNDAPVITTAMNDVTIDEDNSTTVSFTVNDVDDDVSGLTVAAAHPASAMIPALSVTGTGADKSFVITPNANKNGNIDITVTVTDPHGASSSKTFKLTVNPVNDVPAAKDDTATTDENTKVTIDALDNDDIDTKNEGDTLTITGLGATQYGTAAIVNNKIDYTPDASRTQIKTSYTDTFTYTMKDASGATSGASVTVTVTPVNDAPTISHIADITKDEDNDTGDISFTVNDEEDDASTLVVTKTCTNTTLFPLANIVITNPGTGTDRSVKATPVANGFGTATITLTVTDSGTLTASSSFTVTVNSVNDVPANGDDHLSVIEDTRTQLNVLVNDDPDYETTPEDLSIKSVDTTTYSTTGTVEIAGDGKSLYYTSKLDDDGTDKFTYTMHDTKSEGTNGGDFTFTVYITITPVNDAPVVTLLDKDGDGKTITSYTVDEGGHVNGINFKVTDSDNVAECGASCEETITVKSSNPVLVLGGLKVNDVDGTVNRTLDIQAYGKWNGNTTLTITAKDKGGLTGTATISFHVNSVNEPPVANDDTFTIPEDKTTTVDVLGNDTDEDIETNPDTEYILVSSVTDNDPNAVIAVSGDGKGVDITPTANYNGPVSFTYVTKDASDAKSNTAKVNVTVSQVNDPPVANADTKEINEDTAQTAINVLANDTDVDMDAALNANPSAESLSVSITDTGLKAPAHGTISVDTDKNIVYSPAANFNGQDTFEYNAVDKSGAKCKALVTVTVDQVNDNPIAVTDTVSTDEDTALDIYPLANDTDVDTDNTLNLGQLDKLADFSLTSESNPSHGKIALDGNKITYTPSANYFGTDSITYDMSDGHSGTAEGTINITVKSVNDLPVFTTPPADMSLTEDGADGSSNFTVSDVETLGPDLNVTVISSSVPTLIATSDVTVTKGTDGNRTVSVNPENDQNGSSDIVLRVTDADGGKTDYTLKVTVAAVNDTPAAADINGTIDEDTPQYSVSWVTNSSDVDIATNADALTATIENGNGPKHGTASVSGNNLIYTPISNFNGIDTFTYTVTDKGGLTDTGLVTVTVRQVNDAPKANDDTSVSNEDTQATINVLANDTDVDTDATLNADPSAESLSVSISDTGLKAPFHGTISIDASKNILYNPAANFNGTDSFEYNAVDKSGVKSKGTVSLTIKQVNDNPVAVKDDVSTNEDTALDIYPLANDTDVDTDNTKNFDRLDNISALSLTSETGYTNGTIAVAGNKITYTPSANFFGSDAITYKISDGHGGEGTGTINITVNSVNDLPVFTTKPADMPLTEDGDDGSSNFSVSDVETLGPDLNVTVVSSSVPTLIATSDVTITKGTNGNRTVAVNPENNQNSSADITLRVTDADGGTADYTFKVSVTAVNDPPVANDITDSMNEDKTYTVSWKDNSSDVDIATNGDSLSAAIKTGAGPGHGTASVSGDNLVYTPAADWNGVDTFTYTVKDSSGASDTGLVTITVKQVDDPPTAADDSITINEDTPTDIYVLGNDKDKDQDAALNASPGDEVLSASITDTGLLHPAHGSITIPENGSYITYTPAGNYNGTDSFEYNATDKAGAKSKALVTVTIKQVNDNPVAVNDSVKAGNKAPVDIHVLDNDTDVDTDTTLNKDELHYTSSFSVTSYEFVGTGNGTLSEAGGVITFTPDPNFTGIQKIQYTMSDGHGGTAIGNVSVNIGGENAPPTAKDDSIETAEDTTATYNILANDTDIDNDDVLSFVKFTGDTGSIPGTISADAGGNLSFTPSANYHGSFTVGYEIEDSSAATSTANITITVTPVNDAPDAKDKSVETLEDTPITVDVSTLISDPDIATDSDTLSVSVKTGGAPQHGEFTVSGNAISYTPNANWNGTDHVTYTVTDSHSASDTGVITITVDAVNDPPHANNDTVQTNEDTPATIDVLHNDEDADTDPSLNATPQAALTIEPGTLGTPSHGTLSVADNKIVYTPEGDYNGPDSFTYKATDGTSDSQATVSVTVKQVNDAPAANDDTAQITDGDMVSINVLNNDTDIDTLDANNYDAKHSVSDFSVTGVTQPSNGTAAISGKNVNYTAGATFAGDDSFTYTMSDGHGGTATATVRVKVISVNDPPDTPVVATPKEGERYGGSSTIKVTWSDSDIDGDALKYTLEYYDGSAWQRVASDLTDTTYNFVVPATLTSITDLQFRVSAFDGQYTSAYGYSGHVSVDKDVPMNIVVRMTTSDDQGYAAGTWVNKNVTVTAVSITDASKVTFGYGLDDKTYADASNEVITGGEHNVYIKAADEFNNAAEFGGYPVKVDKDAPQVPDKQISVSGTTASVKFTPSDDPGGSGNNYIYLPDGTKKSVSDGGFTWTTGKDGSYGFTIFDNAGNSTDYTVTINQIDETPPDITCDSGDYVIGKTSESGITAKLTYKDDKSGITGKGYAITESKSFSGAYQVYDGDLSLSEGEHYIQAFAKNSAGLETFKTFGPFIVKSAPVTTSSAQASASASSKVSSQATVTASASATPTVTEAPHGDVTVAPQTIIKGAKKIRLPGGEWSDSLVLKDIKPGTYLVEVMDESGNVTLTQVTITDEAIAQGVYYSPKDMTPWYMLSGLGLLILILLLLLARCNIKVEACEKGEESAKVIRTIRRLRRSRSELTIALKAKDIRGSDFGNLIIKKGLTRRMKGNTVIVTVDDSEVFKAIIPDDTDDRFEARIENWEEKE